MAGNYPDNKAHNEHLQVIERWMISNLANQGYEKYDDLHIDRIDRAWRSRDAWLSGGAEAFELAVSLRDIHARMFAITLAYSLRVGAEKSSFSTAAELLNVLDASPPSLYMFKKGREPWLQNPHGAHDSWRTESLARVDAEVISQLFPNAPDCYCLEFRTSPTSDLLRTLVVAA
jgi:hypothetical protein